MKVFDRDGYLVCKGHDTLAWADMAMRCTGAFHSNGWWYFPKCFESYYHLALHHPTELQFEHSTQREIFELEASMRPKLPGFRWEMKTEPKLHQAKGFIEGCYCDRIFNTWEQGLGKTKWALDVRTYRKKQNGAKRCLVLMPKGLMPNWEAEIEKHSYLTCTRVVGPAKRRRKLLEDDSYDLHLMGYDAARVTRVSDICRFDMLICDESTQVANPSAARSREAKRIADAAKYVILMSGTPVGNSLMTLFGQYKILSPGLLGSTQFAFKHRYCVLGGYEGKEIIGYREVGELLSKVRRVSLRATKAQCLDLPEKVTSPIYVELSAEQREVYDTIKKELIAELGEDTITATMFLTQIQKLQQITSGHVRLDSGEWRRFKEQPKRDVLFQYLEHHVSGTGAVIWVFFKESAELLADEFKARGWAHGEITGRTSMKDRALAQLQFQSGKLQFLVCSLTEAAAMGLNLQQNCYTAFYYDHVWSAQVRAQSEDRLHRIGQRFPTFLYELVAKNTVDGYILDHLRSKMAVAQVMTDGKVREELQKL